MEVGTYDAKAQLNAKIREAKSSLEKAAAELRRAAVYVRSAVATAGGSGVLDASRAIDEIEDQVNLTDAFLVPRI